MNENKSRIDMDRMDILRGVGLAAILVAMAVGCAHQPYVHVDTWLMRDNAVPQYFAKYDVFFIHRASSDWELHNSRMVALYDYLKLRVKEPFGRKVRVFAPLLHDDVAVEESELALSLYLDTFHDDGRPYAVLIEGRDEKFVTNFIDACESKMDRKNGFAFFHFETNSTLVVTNAFKDRVERSVDDLAYERQWHRPHPPEDLSKALDINTLANLPVDVFTDDAPSSRDSFKRIPTVYRSATSCTNAVQEAKPMDVKPIDARPMPSVHKPTDAAPKKPPTLEELFHSGSPELQLESSDPMDL